MFSNDEIKFLMHIMIDKEERNKTYFLDTTLICFLGISWQEVINTVAPLQFIDYFKPNKPVQEVIQHVSP